MLQLIAALSNILTLLASFGALLLNTDFVKSNPTIAAVLMLVVGAVNLILHYVQNKEIKKQNYTIQKLSG